jgi:hypothetical protein
VCRARTRDLVDRRHDRGPVRHDRRGLVGVAELDVLLVELHRLARDDRVSHLSEGLPLGAVAPQQPRSLDVDRRIILGVDPDRPDERAVVHGVLDRALRVARVDGEPLRLVGLEELLARSGVEHVRGFQHRL